MVEVDPDDIDSVAVEPEHCHRCGTALETAEFEGRETPWCPSCDLLLSRNPVAGVHGVVHDGEAVLLLDEQIPQHEGVLSLPGGYARPDEGPKESLARELREETGLQADPADMAFLTVLHAAFPGHALYLLTYEIPRTAVSGDLTAEYEEFEAAYRPFADVRASDKLRDSDRERIAMALQ